MSAAVQEEEKGSWEGTAQRAREKREGVRREAPKRIDRRRLAQPGAGERGEKRGRASEHKHGSVEWDGMGTSFAFVRSFVRSAHFREKKPFHVARRRRRGQQRKEEPTE